MKLSFFHFSKEIKAAVWYAISNILVKGIAFMSAPIFTRLLSPTEYGTASIYSAYQQIILILATWEMYMGAYQLGIIKYAEDRKGIASSILLFVNVFTIIFFVFFLVVWNATEYFSLYSWSTILFLFLYLFFMPSYSSWVVEQRTDYKYKNVAGMSITSALAMFIIPLCFVLFGKRTGEYKYLGDLAGGILIALPFYYKTLRNYFSLSLSVIKKYWRFAVPYTLPLIFHSLSYFILGTGDRLFIQYYRGYSAVAFYSVAYSLGMAFTILSQAINQSFLPWLYTSLKNKQIDKVSHVVNTLLQGIIFVLLIFIAALPEVFSILFPESYKEAIWALPPIVMSIFFLNLYSVFVNVITFYEKTRYIMYISVMVAGINVLLNYFMVPVYSYYASAWITLVTYMLFAIGQGWYMHEVSKEKLGTKIYDYKKIIKYSAFLLVMGASLTLVYTMPFIRYFLLICFTGVLLKKKNKILQGLKTTKT